MTGVGTARRPADPGRARRGAHAGLPDQRHERQPDQAFAAFCDREYRRLTGLLSLYCGDVTVAEELAQEALVRAADHWDAVRTMDQPVAWLRRVAFNLAHSHFRRLAAERRANARYQARTTVSARHLDDEVATNLTVRRAVARLPDRQRRVVILRFYLDRSVDQAAAELGLTPVAVTSLTHRAVRQLRRDLHDADAVGLLEEEH